MIIMKFSENIKVIKMKQKNLAIIFCALYSASALADIKEFTLTTIADSNEGSKHFIPVAPTPSLGDMFIFDQPLKNKDMTKFLGTNSGFCVATKPGSYSQCQWTLTLAKGTITVAGQEAETGTSIIPIIGTTGSYANYTGELKTFPNGDGTYTQILSFYPKAKK